MIDATPVYVTEDGRGVAGILVNILNEAGADATVCANPPADAKSVICLTGLKAANSPEEAAQLSAEGFGIATSMAATLETEGGLFVTVQDTGGDHSIATPSIATPSITTPSIATPVGMSGWLGGFSGLAKTAAQEWPKAIVRSIDVARHAISPKDDTGHQLPSQEIAQRLATEMLTGGRDREIGLPADGRRLAFTSTATPVGNSSRQPAVNSDSVIIVSGGGRGVTAAAIIELAGQSQAKFALLGRSALEEEPAFLQACQDDAALKKALLGQAKAAGQKLTPKALSAAANKVTAGREIRETLAALSAVGAEARYLSCDITNMDSTGATLQEVRNSWGPITGIVHGAGVLADKRLTDKTVEDFQRVFHTKVLGLHSLLTATQADPLKLICLFSSVAGRTGNVGQADYAMANEVLNRVAQAEAKGRQGGCIVKSIGWGPWEGGMVTPLLKAKFEEMGVGLIPVDAGARSFAAEVQHASAAQVDVVIGGGPPQNGPLLGEAQAAQSHSLTYDITLSEQTHPYLRSHQINGAVVLPLVIAQEYFLRAAATLVGEPFRGRCQNLRVLKGLPLPGFGTEKRRLRVSLKTKMDEPHIIQAMLTDAQGIPRYSAQLVFDGSAGMQKNIPLPETPLEWPRQEKNGVDLYKSVLFHGPDFAALQRMNRMGQSGAEATLVGSQALGWPLTQEQNRWATDPALIDGGLQVAQLWGLEHLSSLTLPTNIGELLLYKPGLHDGGRDLAQQVRVLLRGQVIGTSGIRCDLWFVDDARGDLIAEIHGLEMYTFDQISV